MKFKEGDAVEVLRITESGQAWFPAKVISANGHKFLVRFDHGEIGVQKERIEDVRPCPPAVCDKEKWVLGDTAEVFDHQSWRVGKIVKVLSGNRFVIKMSGSILLKEFHASNLRVQQDWHSNAWAIIGKIKNKHANAMEDTIPEACARAVRIINGKHASQMVLTAADAVDGSVKKRKPTVESKKCQLSKRGLPKQVHAFSPPKAVLGEKCMITSKKQKMIGFSGKKLDITNKNNHAVHPFSIPVQVVEDNNECSVASCSSNHLEEYNIHNFRKKSRDIAVRSSDDAESSCPAEPRKQIGHCGKDDLSSSVHKLELLAYQSTVQAFYASGPLSWEQESLLTNLRLSLNISNEEHLLQLRHLLSVPVP